MRAKENSKQKIFCAHYASRYLSITEFWLYQLIINHHKFTPIFLTRKKENFSLFSMENIYSLGDLSLPRRIVEMLLFKILGYFPFFKAILEKHRVGILHVHFGYNGIKAIKLKQRSGTAMLCSFYGDDAYRYPSLPGYAEKYERLFIEAERILVLGPYMKSSLVKLGCPEDKIIIHHLGVNLDSVPFRQRPLKKRGIRFLVAAGFVEKKGIDLVITSLSSLSEKYDFTLDIIGDGPLRNEVYSWVESSGIKERITMHGFKPNKFLIEKALDCDVFIQASRTTRDNHKEGTPMAIVDAMATGLAVVSTHHSDIPEIVLDGVTGFLAEENDVDSLTACIKKILDNPEFIGPMGEAGRKRVEAEFNALTQTEKLEAIYSELLGKG